MDYVVWTRDILMLWLLNIVCTLDIFLMIHDIGNMLLYLSMMLGLSITIYIFAKAVFKILGHLFRRR